MHYYSILVRGEPILCRIGYYEDFHLGYKSNIQLYSSTVGHFQVNYDLLTRHSTVYSTTMVIDVIHSCIETIQASM